MRPFQFRDAVRITCPTGVSAATLREFRIALESCDTGVLHHHLRETALRFTFAMWDYPNDFALWAAEALERRALAERLAALDPFHHTDLETLRELLLEAVELEEGDAGAHTPVPVGQEFAFCRSLAVEIELDVQVSNLCELRRALGLVPASSLFHHLYEARLRNPAMQDDCSLWLAEIGELGAATRLADLDIYMLSLEDCRRVVLELLNEPDDCR